MPKLEGAPLVAFLKAMEFTTITKRVADICGLDANAIEADPRFVGAGGWRGRNGEPTSREPAAPTVERVSVPAGGQTSAPATSDQAGDPSPQTLAATRATKARAEPFDVAAYQTVSDIATLQAWIERAYDTGVVAFDTETSSLDPLQAELVGVSLAVAPGEACYIPIGHRNGAADLFDGGGLLSGQIAEAEALALLKPLLEDPGVLKIGQNVKFDWHVFARARHRGRAVRRHDADLLRARFRARPTTATAWTRCRERWLGHKPIAFSEVAGSGRNFIGFARVAIDKATRIRRRGRRRDPAPVARAQAAPRAPRA